MENNQAHNSAGAEVGVRELTALTVCGLLSLIVRLVPGETGVWAGAGGWLSPLIALPFYLLALLALVAVFRRLPRGTGLGGLYRLAFGRWWGRFFTVLTGVWLLLIAAVALRFYVESVVSSVYGGTAMWLFLAGLMAVVWWACAQGRGAVCRMGQIFLRVLEVILALILLLGLRETHLYHVWPFWLEGAGGLLRSALPVTVILGYSIPVLFLRGELADNEEGRGIAVKKMTGLSLISTGAAVVILGMFGWKTAARLQAPFFSVAKEVSILNVVERAESVVAAVWVLSDAVLIAALLDASTGYLQRGALPLRRKLIYTAGGVAVIAGAALIGPTLFQLRELWVKVLWQGDAGVCYLLPLAACGTVWIKKGI